MYVLYCILQVALEMDYQEKKEQMNGNGASYPYDPEASFGKPYNLAEASYVVPSAPVYNPVIMNEMNKNSSMASYGDNKDRKYY